MKKDIKPTYEFSEVPTNLLLQKHIVSIELDGETYKGSGEIYLEFSPDANLKIYTLFPEISASQALDLFNTQKHASLIINSARIKCLLIGTGKDGFTFVWRPRHNQLLITGNKKTQLTQLDFHLFNFANLFGVRSSIEPEDPGGNRIEHLDLKFNNWLIEIKSLTFTRDNFQKLSTEGGYQLTHVGRIQKIQSEIFSGEECLNLLEALRFFLSFAKGEYCRPIFTNGKNLNKKEVWKTFDVPDSSSEKVSSWFDLHTGSQLVKLFPGFMTKWMNIEWQQAVKEVLYWYLNGINPKSSTSAHIILIQAGIERLSYEFVVKDKKLLTSKGFKDLWASDKMRLLFSSLGLPLDIPSELVKMKSLASKLNLFHGLKMIPHTLLQG